MTIGGSSVSPQSKSDTRSPHVTGWPSSYALARTGEGEARSPLPHSAPKSVTFSRGRVFDREKSPFFFSLIPLMSGGGGRPEHLKM